MYYKLWYRLFLAQICENRLIFTICILWVQLLSSWYFAPGIVIKKLTYQNTFFYLIRTEKPHNVSGTFSQIPIVAFFKGKKYINILLRLSSQKYMFCLGNMQLNVGLFVCYLFRDQRNVPEQFIFDRKVIIVQKHKQVRWHIGRSDGDLARIYYSPNRWTIFIERCFYI